MNIYCLMMYFFNSTNDYEPALLGYPGEEPEEFWDFDYNYFYSENYENDDYIFDTDNDYVNTLISIDE